MEKKKSARTSIVVPVYNDAAGLKKLLESIVPQIGNSELIVVDDCSNDGSFDVASKYTKNVIKHAKNMGPAVTRNDGIRNANGDIIIFIDSDCIAERDWFRNMIKCFEDSKIMVVMGNVRIPESTYMGNSISALGFPAGGSIGFEKMWRVSGEGFTDHISSCNFAGRSIFFKKYGMFDETFPLPGGEDSEFSYRISNAGVKIKYCRGSVVYHRPRKGFYSFIRWQTLRGRSNYQFRKRVGKVGGFLILRLWSTKNVIRESLFRKEFPMVVFLLILSFIFQQVGYMKEKRNDRNR